MTGATASDALREVSRHCNTWHNRARLERAWPAALRHPQIRFPQGLE
ncbi:MULTISPECIES: hypothetical protein [Paraburkholderia]|nr:MULTISPECIES: hypothetical protein [Paraburkholderia]